MGDNKPVDLTAVSRCHSWTHELKDICAVFWNHPITKTLILEKVGEKTKKKGAFPSVLLCLSTRIRWTGVCLRSLRCPWINSGLASSVESRDTSIPTISVDSCRTRTVWELTTLTLWGEQKWKFGWSKWMRGATDTCWNTVLRVAVLSPHFSRAG